ncbi:hypothetical protein PENNAL_c0991G04630, partial [Penicillium nalgiovense]
KARSEAYLFTVRPTNYRPEDEEPGPLAHDDPRI